MRIAVITGIFPLLSEIFIIRACAALIEAGHEIDLYTMQRSKETLVQSQVSQYQMIERLTCLYDGYESGPESTYYQRKRQKIRLKWILPLLAPKAVIDIFRNKPADSERGWWKLPFHQLDRLRQGRRRGYDIVHCHFGNVAKRLIYIRDLFGAKLIVSFYGSDYHTFPRIYGESVFTELFKVADAVTVVSDHGRARLIELGCPPESVVTQYIGVDLDLFSYRARHPKPNQPIRLLTVARLVEVKGIEWAIRAVARLAPTHPIHYEIVGDGPLRGELERLADSLGISDIVDLSGPADAEMVSRKMKAADIFILSSLNEGLPGVTIEAQATGLPVVATKVGGSAEGIVDGGSGFLVPARDDRAFADRLAYLIDHPHRRWEMGKTGRNHVASRFDITTTQQSVEQLYQRLMRGDAV